MSQQLWVAGKLGKFGKFRNVWGRRQASGEAGRVPRSASQTHCAAQAEYGRLAAQAYSPSDAMSQAGICLDGIQKVQRRPDELGKARSTAAIPGAVGAADAAGPAFGAGPGAAPDPAAAPAPARG